ncbi:MAG: baseplate J/gp47 family protein [Oscillospiraceae bacterium]|jgi:hypothetical protein
MSGEFIIDGRSLEDLRRRFGELAESYVPEWRFSVADPDAGSTLALIFLDQMYENIGRLNQTFDKYHTEFANLLGVSLLPASPSSGIVVARLASDTIPGVPLRRGTRLLGEGENKPLVFETTGDVYVTSAEITDLLEISPRRGKILALQGGPDPIDLFGEPFGPDEEPGGEGAGLPPPSAFPFTLYDFDEDGIEQNTLCIFHQSVLHADAGTDLLVRPVREDGSSAAALLCDGTKFEWLTVTENGFASLSAREENGCVCLHTETENSVKPLDGTPFYALCARCVGGVSEPLVLSDLRVAASCTESAPEFTLHGESELEPGNFLPFGETATLYDECYIGSDRMFARSGATLTMRFTLAKRQKLVTMTPEQEDAELKVIKRKPRAVLFDTVTTCPERVTAEYFNGIGWRMLPGFAKWAALFDGNHCGDVEISFVCPDDWKPMTVGSFYARALRLRIAQADNCYLQPCIHTMPLVTNLRIDCAYEGEWPRPQRVRAVSGVESRELTQKLLSHECFEAFLPLTGGRDAFYLGLDKRPEGAPVSMLIETGASVLPDGRPLEAEYSTLSGFKPLKLIDNTRAFSRPGTLQFLPPSDFAPASVAGVQRYWIRFPDRDPEAGGARFRPEFRNILLNAAEIRNIETHDEESFYVEAAVPNMRFPLGVENICSAEVWVSEMPRFTPSGMEKLAAEQPDRVRISHDILGNITSFFVRWDEVENFDNSRSGDRHYIIDRMNSAIVFGDGTDVLIPPAQRGVAFTVRATSCSGRAGDLPAGAVNALYDETFFVGSVENPVATSGGSDLETIAGAAARAAAVVSGHGRLVSERDYVREVFAYSDTIEKVRCIAGYDLWGAPAPGSITVAVLCRDFADASYSFLALHDGLCRRLLQKSPATVTARNLTVCEPVYVAVSVSVWAGIEDVARSIDVQTHLSESIARFLDPLRGGWEIGRLPTQLQLHQMLHALRFPGHVEKFIASARWTDGSGTHETELDRLPPNPLMIAVCGETRVFLEASN